MVSYELPQYMAVFINMDSPNVQEEKQELLYRSLFLKMT